MRPNILAALLLGTASLAAQATTQMTVTLSDFSLSLKDLNLSDGVAPSISWAPSWQLTSAFSEWAQTGSHIQYNTVLTDWTQPDFHSNTVFNNAGSVSIDAASGQAHAFSGVLASTPTPIVASASVEAGHASSAGGNIFQDFTLAAGTQVTFSVLLSGSLSGTTAPAFTLPAGATGVGNYSTAQFEGSLLVGSIQSTSRYAGSNNWLWSPDAYEASTESQLLKLTVKNTGNTDKTYLLAVIAGGNVQEALTPIPEPSTYAMMAMGLLAIGAVRRKRS